MTQTNEERESPPAAIDTILERAAQRGRQHGLAYAGAVTPREAHQLHEAGVAAVVDVRTQPEWQFVGHVPGVPRIEWPRGGAQEHVAAFVAAIGERFGRDDTLLLLCRSGVRSHYAAARLAEAGFARAYNVLEGFEGDQGAGHNGWKASGLPWKK